MTVVLAMNEKDTLSVTTAVADLRDVVLETDPDLGILNEWSKSRDAATSDMLERLGYGYGRPKRGGGPVFWRLSKYRLRSVKGRILALSEFVGHLPGRRSRLGISWCTEANLDNLDLHERPDGKKTTVLGAHLTAEIQDVRGGGGYKTGVLYFFRVRRHKREKRRWGRLGRRHLRRGHDTKPAGDTNFTGMQLGGFHNCWDGYDGGDLGGRAVTIVYATVEPTGRPRTVKTRSDHLAVAVTYG